MSTISPSITSIHWFRKGLRIHDNPALIAAASGMIYGEKKYNIAHCLPIFILDPWFVKSGLVGKNRMQFLLETLQDLNNQLESKFQSKLLIFQGKPHEILPKLWKEYNIKLLSFELDTEPYALERDYDIVKMATESKIQIFSPVSHTLLNMYDIESYFQPQKTTSCLQYSSFVKYVESQNIETPYPQPDSKLFAPLPKIQDESYMKTIPKKLSDIDFPGEDINPKEHTPHYGGEIVAIKRMYAYLSDKNKVIKFSKPETRPTAFNPADTTVLSPYLKFGCLSSRFFYYELKKIIDANKKVATQPPTSLLGQLYWREFFYYQAYTTPGFSCIKENKNCIQVPWRDETDPQGKMYFEAWKNAKTGYPFIDACMMQLKKEGFMHHLARHAVACFLTRGDLWCSWELGVKVFDELLLDADYALNNGNWMWLSASCFFYQYFRVYGPVSFPKKTDKEGAFVRHYLPELKDFPSKYIYEPWTAPLEVQKKAGCIIGKDYPSPIVVHEVVSKENIDKMKVIYANKSFGVYPKDKLNKWQIMKNMLFKKTEKRNNNLNKEADERHDGEIKASVDMITDVGVDDAENEKKNVVNMNKRNAPKKRKTTDETNQTITNMFAKKLKKNPDI